MRLWLRVIVVLLTALILAVVAGAGYARVQLGGSLPDLDGVLTVPGMKAAAAVARDRFGVPTITGASREDVARALGFVHAQDRFFQMDLQRRQPAGELSALVGARALPLDRQARINRFRTIARQAYERTDHEWRAVLDAYAEGVNAGLAALGKPPFEYLLLGQSPQPWTPEDSLLTLLSMFVALQGRQALFEQTVAQIHDALPEPLARFLTAAGSSWETPVEGPALERPPIPSPDVIDLRARRPNPPVRSSASASRCVPSWPLARAGLCRDPDADAILGSNNWAVTGSLTADGGALVANDMHLNLGVPNIWYRAAMVLPDPAEPLTPLRIVGVTLPGLPTIVVGSNGHVAWGFTNSAGDWSDLVRLYPDPRNKELYFAPDGPRTFESVAEQIEISGQPAEPVSSRWTIWGPVVWTDSQGNEYAQRWVAHDPAVLASDLSRVERARSVDELLLIMPTLGIPHQNVAMADRAGHIAWTIGGVIPRRAGLDGFTPSSWSDGSKGWQGYLEPGAYPRIVNPASGRLWTANAPVVSGEKLAVIGDGGYADGIRARLIRDRLAGIDRATPAAMLDVQLETRALFLDRWRTLVLDVLGSEAARAGDSSIVAARAEFKQLVETTWTGAATPDSVAYRLVRLFRTHVVRMVLTFVTGPALEKDASFDYTRSPRTEGPVWQLVGERPMHLLDPAYPSWPHLLVAAVDAAVRELTEGGRTLSERTWGEQNRVDIAHPLAASVPYLSGWLRMPADPLPGDVFTPRAHSPRAGPSERMAVSPGQEELGVLHMPTGQSAHPLSPHFNDMQRAWVEGRSVPFLPGATEHTLTLTPKH